MNNKVAFLTTIFPMPDAYISDFFKSLIEQTAVDWDLILVNDGCLGIEDRCKEYINLNIVLLNPGDSFVDNRKVGINYVINHGYEFLIFGDADDYFSSNRIAMSVELLQQSDVIVNDLSTITEKGELINENVFSKRIEDGSQINIDFILDKNIFGLSNTAVKVKVLSDLVYVRSILALDWFIYSQILLRDNIDARFVNNVTTYYRQHDSNIAGINKISEDKIMSDINVVFSHYDALRKIDKRFEKLYHLAEKRKKLLSEDKSKLDDFIFRVKLFFRGNSFWWEHVLGIKMDNYENKHCSNGNKRGL